MRPEFAPVMETLKKVESPICSVDIPSGRITFLSKPSLYFESSYLSPKCLNNECSLILINVSSHIVIKRNVIYGNVSMTIFESRFRLGY